MALRKRKTKDPTSSSIKNSSSKTRRKEEGWLQDDFPDNSLAIITNDPDYNIQCKACNAFLHCTCKSDLRTHIKNKSHPKKLKLWKQLKELEFKLIKKSEFTLKIKMNVNPSK
eukprot:501579_1